MRCPACHSQNPRRAKFCMDCGASLARTVAAPTGAQGKAPIRTSLLVGQVAERRQLTVLFCDIVESTALSDGRDPEELREVHASYHQVCTTVIRRFEGHIAHYLGDGIVVYFGFPLAHDDDAQRAVRSGLGIVEGMGQLNARLQREKGIRLTVRIAIHTGVVVADNIDPDAPLESGAVTGDTTNITHRLQSLAPHDSVVISNATYRLIAGHFDCQELGFHSIRGVAQPLALYRVLHESTARTRFDVAVAQGLSPLEGRDAERAILIDRWERASAGTGQVLLVSGEPGIGKSRLIRSLEEHVAQDPRAFLIRQLCTAYQQNTAFFPMVELLERTVLQFTPDDTADQKLNKIEGHLTRHGFALREVVPLVANLLSVPLGDRYTPSDLPLDRQKLALMEWGARTMLVRAEQQPTLFLFEDLHWVDPSTLDFLTLLIDRAPSARLLIVLSFRPEFTPPWTGRSHVTQVPLGRLAPDASAAIVKAVAGDKSLPLDVLSQLLVKTDGVPLFIEELTKFVLESDLLREVDGKLQLMRPLPPLAIPATLVDLLTARLDRLASAKIVAQLGAAIGREFFYELLREVLDTIRPADEVTLRRDLAQLVDAGLLIVTGEPSRAAYAFKHALIQDAAYGSLLRRTRQQYHERIAQVLEKDFSETVETRPELLAHHYLEAGLVAESLPYWLKAGQRALRGSANVEAIAHLTLGWDALKTLSEGPEKMAQELTFCLTLGPAYMATRGYAAPEVEACYRRAQELCQQLGNPPQLGPVLHGLWTYHITGAHHVAALELARQVLGLGESAGDSTLRLYGNMDVGWSHFFSGRPSDARQYLERVLTLYDHRPHGSLAYTFGNNAATSAGGCLAQTLWLLGYPERAIRASQEQLALLRELTHPLSVAFGLDLTGFIRQYLGDPRTTREVAEEAIAISNEQGAQFALMAAMGTILRGWSLARQGAIDEGVAQMRQGLTAHLATGAALIIPYSHWLLAQAYGEIGRYEEGLALLDEAEEAIERSDERYWEAEIHRLRGDLLARANGAAGSPGLSPEACYLLALDVARRQRAKSLELRAATSLARLWQQQGKEVEARRLLASTYGWFTEGFATPDLQAARTLLAELESPVATA